MNEQLFIQVQMLTGLALLAVLAIAGGFAWARQARLSRECAKRGHQWADGFTGLECERCGRHELQD